MSANVQELLFDYALGTLSDEEVSSVETAVEADQQLREQLRDIVEDLGCLAAELPAAPPPPAFKDRLLSAIAHHGRLEGFAAQVADMIDASMERARHLLRLVDDDSAWLSLFPGCDALHIRPGPRVATQDVGLIRMAAGSTFPKHTHLGDEHVLVLQGRLRDDADGNEYGPGEVTRMTEGSSHSFQVTSAEGLVYLVVAGGVDIPGLEIEEPPPEQLH